jgi:site-specific DNA-adenine methylase
VKKYGIPYMGSKSRIADKIINILPVEDTFVDLFAGGCAMTHCAMESGKYNNFIINDISDSPLLFIDAMNGKLKDENRWISREDFFRLKEIEPYVRICWSFGNNQRDYLYSKEIEAYKRAYHYTIFFHDYEPMKKFGMDFSELENIGGGGYKERIMYVKKYIIPKYSNKKELYIDNRLQELERLERINDLHQRLVGLNNFNLFQMNYKDVVIPENSCVYCDPPYANSQKYGSEKREDFDTDELWQWCREREFPVYVSEYAAPDDFISIFNIELNSTLCATNNARKKTEHVFVYKKFYDDYMNKMKSKELLLF